MGWFDRQPQTDYANLAEQLKRPWRILVSIHTIDVRRFYVSSVYPSDNLGSTLALINDRLSTATLPSRYFVRYPDLFMPSRFRYFDSVGKAAQMLRQGRDRSSGKSGALKERKFLRLCIMADMDGFVNSGSRDRASVPT